MDGMQKCRQNKAEHFRLQQPEIRHINALKIVMDHKDFVPRHYQRPYSTPNVSCIGNNIY